jgi:cell division protein FtsZ
MIQFDLPKQQSSIIKVIGVGGGGSNAVNYMHSLGIESVDFLVCNTDAQALALSQVPNKIQLGPSLTQGLGAGANPEIGRQATQESLEEIRRILEVNTKMAFVTAGMGGGTGTGGAPIIAKICRDMGILTVGIVTTPFSYEGKKRSAYANEGIQQLKSCVDTLLVISNDKLRHQFGNLTMSAALSTADNVLATAAKCITDVINTTGQINVDFADVCTVMRNGGVAILGSARAKGEHRAQLAIEQALNSPLLNDNDIRGAKWVLININSRPGEHEFTMDEVETIQEYLLTQAGSDADVILGLGYDESLGDDISITIIATGFDQKNGTDKIAPLQQQEPDDARIVLTLEVPQKNLPDVVLVEAVLEQELSPEIAAVEVEDTVSASVEYIDTALQLETPAEVVLDADQPIVFELSLDFESKPEPIAEATSLSELTETPSDTMMAKVPAQETSQEDIPVGLPVSQLNTSTEATAGIGSNGFLKKPSVIYVSEDAPLSSPLSSPAASLNDAPAADELKQEQPVAQLSAQEKEMEASTEDLFELVFHEEVNQEVTITPVPEDLINMLDEPNPFDEAEAQRAKAAERIHKLRNLSYNFNASDPNNEYDSVPAYVRHNLQVHNTTLASVEKFYSSYAVGMDDNNVAQISTINTFLEGKKPD